MSDFKVIDHNCGDIILRREKENKRPKLFLSEIMS